MSKKKVLLINPPAKKRYIRDLYCSKLASGAYYWEPVDLVVMSGLLNKDFSLKVMDCIAQSWSLEETVKIIEREKFDIIVSLIGSASLDEDIKFLKKIKTYNNPHIAVSGDVVLGEATSILKQWSFINTCILDFTTSDLPLYFKTGETNRSYEGIIYSNKNHRIVDQHVRNYDPHLFVPQPRHDLFPLKKYQMPFFESGGVAEITSSIGCPFKCTFCISGTLPFRHRDPKDVLEEIRNLISLDVRQFAFRDPLFEANTERAKEICKLIIDNNLDVNWCCNSRVDTILIDRELLSLMSKAGCKMILFGVESGNDAILKSVNKGITTLLTEKAFRESKQNKIGTSAYVIIGLPEDTNETIQKTIDFTKKLDPEFAIFSIPSPDYRTKMREHFISEGKIKNDFHQFDRGGSKNLAIATKYLTAANILNWQKEAFREFYLRPSYIFNHLGNFIRPGRIKIILEEFLALLKNYLISYAHN